MWQLNQGFLTVNDDDNDGVLMIVFIESNDPIRWLNVYDPFRMVAGKNVFAGECCHKMLWSANHKLGGHKTMLQSHIIN